ncbi:S49 family peptidase [Desulfuromonas sp. DDH964]|nr:S49 family peptidase [Desulfuromonas sp. DDH964]
MALLTLGAIFLFFLFLIVAVSGLRGPASGLALGDKVGVIEVLGVIADSRELTRQIVDFRNNESVKAVVLRVDSPGGGVGPSQEICEEVGKLAAVKPVVVSMGSVAASGGYYIAAPATRILANPGTITGSIGVIMEFANIEELLGKVGLRSEVVKSGAHKDIGSPTRTMTPADRAILQGMIDDVYDQFVNQIAHSRKLPLDQVKALADGRIFSGRQALAQGLVDELGNFQDAVAVAGQLAGLEGEPRLLYPPQKKPAFLDYLVEETTTRFAKGLTGAMSPGLQYLWTHSN